jgi:hypothetical protein
VIRAFVGAVAVAAFIAAIASVSSSQAAVVNTGLDLDISGNAASSVGSIQSCASLQPGDTLQIDFWITGAPPPAGAEGGVAAFTYYLHFDPAVVKVTAVDNKFMIVDGGGNLTVDIVDANPGSGLEGLEGDPLPATTGNLRVESAEIAGPFESGDGILSRITLQAIAAGSSDLTLRDDQYDNYPAPSILEGGTGNLHFVNSVQNGIVVVGGSCAQQPAPTPLDIGGLGGTIPGGATFPPASPDSTGGSTSPQPTEPGQTAAPGESPGADSGPSVAIDAVPTGNEANVIGEIETCARANKGDTFNVDMVVKDVKDLLAFEAAVKYDGGVLDIVGSDTKLFLANGEGSNVNDTSAHTPDDSGRYVAGAVDLADPAEPDSGSGVLVRLTIEATGDGTSQLSLKQADSNDDGKMDEGVFLRNVDGDIIGDANGDTFFDGPAGDAEIRVGKDCPDSDAKVVIAADNSGDENGDGGGGFPWPIAGGVAAAVVVAAGAAFYVLRIRRGGSVGPGDGDATV